MTIIHDLRHAVRNDNRDAAEVLSHFIKAVGLLAELRSEDTR